MQMRVAQAHAQEAQAPDVGAVAVVAEPQPRHAGSVESPVILDSQDSEQSSEDGDQTPTLAVVPNSPAPSSPVSQYTPSHVAFSPATAAARLAVFGMPQPRLLC